MWRIEDVSYQGGRALVAICRDCNTVPTCYVSAYGLDARVDARIYAAKAIKDIEAGKLSVC